MLAMSRGVPGAQALRPPCSDGYAAMHLHAFGQDIAGLTPFTVILQDENAAPPP